MLKFLILSFLFLSSLAAFVKAAGPTDIVINEVAWMGSKIDDIESKNHWRYEWLELYNNTNEAVSLDNWKIEFYRQELDWSLNLAGVILPRNYFLIAASDKIANFDLNYSNLGGKLNNSGQKLVLKNETNAIIDEVDSSTGWFAGDNNTKQTMERISPVALGSNPQNWLTSLTVGGTPKAKNSVYGKSSAAPSPSLSASPSPEPVLAVETPLISPETIPTTPALTPIPTPTTPSPSPTPSSSLVDYSLDIFINEILPSSNDQDSEGEWIEIFNQGKKDINLAGWKIQDKIGAIKIYVFPEGTKIPTQGFLVIPRQKSKIVLNNDMDGLKLIWPDNKVVEEINYEKAPKGESFSKTSSREWMWSKAITPGSANIIPVKIAKAEPEQLIKEPIKTVSSAEKTASIGEKTNNKGPFLFLIGLGGAFLSGFFIFILKNKLRKTTN